MNIKKWWSKVASSSLLLRYHLDYPSHKNGCPREEGGWVVQGWVLFRQGVTPSQLGKKPYLGMKINENLLRVVHLDRARPDVLREVLLETDLIDSHPQLYCGFRFLFPLDGVTMPIYLYAGNKKTLLTEITLPLQPRLAEPIQQENTALKVLKGKDNWLFLDNDTNFSVDQHRGYIALSDSCLELWAKYVSDWKETFSLWGSKAIFLVAPTKESVLGKYHPYAEADEQVIAPIFQLMSADMYLYPMAELKAVGDQSFYKTDTHWTHIGAGLTTKLVAQKLGLHNKKIEAVFKKDQYQTKAHVGDLGNKLDPPNQQLASFLIGFNYRKWIVFDNALPNFGRVLCIEYEPALIDGTCLVFGSSSSYSMFSYLCRLFRRVLFIHSAGCIDRTLLLKVKPDYCIAQTNARFMVRAPHFDFNVLTTIKEKVQELTPEELDALPVINKKNKTVVSYELHNYMAK